jgi:hypothetical protein
MPFVRVYTKSDVLLDILNATNVAISFPRELIVRRPSCTHAEEGSMGDSLCICGDAIVLVGGEIDVLRSKARHYILDKGEVGVRSAMLDQYQWLPLRIHTGAVKRMYGNNADVFWQTLLKSFYLWSLARGLSSDNSTDLGRYALMSAKYHPGCSRDPTGTESLHDCINILCLYAVNDKIAASRNEVAVQHNLNVGLAQAQYVSLLNCNMYGCYPTKSRNSSTRVSYLSGRSQALTLGVRHQYMSERRRNL